jgi:hypothetical protein
LFWVLPLILLAPCLIGQGFYAASDLLLQYVPDQMFMREQLSCGNFPLWNPYIFGGQPFAADPNNMAFNPFQLLSLLLPGVWAPFVLLLFHLSVSGWGMARWLKTAGVEGLGRWLGAGVYMASGFASYEVIHPPVMGAYAFFPWVMAYLELWSREPGDRQSAFKAGLAGALVVLSGNPQTALAVFYAAIFYLVARGWHHHRFGEWRKPTSALSLGVLLIGALPALALIVPLAEWKPLATRASEIGDYLRFNAAQSIHPSEIYRLLFPLHPETPLRGMNPEDPYLVDLAYVGWVPLLLMIAALQEQKRRALVVGLLLMGLTGWLLAFGRYTPFHEWVCQIVPGMAWNRAPFRFLFLWTSAVAFLTGLGFQTGSSWDWKAEERRAVDVLVPLLFAGWCWGAVHFDAFRWWEAVILAAGVLAWCTYRLGRSRVASALLVVAVLGPLVAPFWRLYAVSRADLYLYATRLPWLSSLRESVGTSRVFLDDGVGYPDPQGGTTVVWTPNTGVLSGLRNVGGYNPLTLRRTMETHRLPFATFNRLWAMRCFVAGKEYVTQPGFERLVLGEDFGYRYLEPRPILYAPKQVRWVTEERAALEGLMPPESDPYRLSYLLGPPQNSGADTGILMFVAERMETDAQRWKLSKDKPGWVVFSEVMYPGWKAQVDGKPVPIVTANTVFRAVWVPQGEHLVEFNFRPIWWPWIPVGLCLWMITVGVWWWRDRRKFGISK